ncbi:type VII secretion-associated protein [Prescottella equi]|uniref:Type VII secretion-associated protein n=1 Tax=Rhodococcus hoagii TaxID=43767 RepID=A0A9Q2Z1W1_RHOHA|nr:type VII secretion-associated protein [Prescottella equi]MBM4481469.1 type VII secretion-associated protein [Prescottella equi]MBM4491845.1 type VII secretion-associated protein [Prescottella equi]MBM4497953.1 type VII secretion-associated protein [Prescottella equi]MBM4506638.1 type VII secretion-associated protein [Prescottella equi]MBM4517814.1 type VII secretion-associated protein [Prescottella equi]
MVAPVVTSRSVVVHLGVDTVWVGTATGVDASADEELRECVDAIDDEFVDSAQHVRPTVEALASVIARAVRKVSERDGFVDVMTILHPSHWGRTRRGVLGAAARRSANEVETLPIALAVPAPTSSGAWIVVECAETTTTAVAVRPGPQGTSEIMACAFAPSTGVLDLGAGADASAGASASAGTDAAPDTGIEAGSAWIAVVNELIDEVSGDEGAGPVCVVGPSAETVARVLSTDSGRDVRVVPEPALVACRTASSESGAGSGSDASEPARRSWVDQVPRPEPVRPTGRSVVIGASIAAVALLFAVGSMLAVRYTRGSEPQPAAAPAQRVEIGRASTELPDSWHVRGDRSGRLDLVPDDGRDGRIVVLPTELAVGSAWDSVVRGLERKIGERGAAGPFSDFAADVEFGGRRSAAYVEAPADGSRVRWYVLLEDDVQVSVGCQYRDAGWEAIAEDCEQAVRAVTVASAR